MDIPSSWTGIGMKRQPQSQTTDCRSIFQEWGKLSDPGMSNLFLQLFRANNEWLDEVAWNHLQSVWCWPWSVVASVPAAGSPRSLVRKVEHQLQLHCPNEVWVSETYVDERYVRWARVLDELGGDNMTMLGIEPSKMVLLNEKPFHLTVCSSQICRRISAGISKSWNMRNIELEVKHLCTRCSE